MANSAIAPPGQVDTRRIDITTALLANAATYTSNGFRIEGWDKVSGLCFSDQAGTLNIDQSIDGTNWDYTTSSAVTASTGLAFEIDLYAEWVRIRFTNSGGSTQTAFRLATYVKAY